MSKFKKMCEAVISKGLLRAMSNPLKQKAICDNCGYMMPMYPGKYSNCPLCGNKIVQNTISPSPNQDGGELEVVDDENITAVNNK